MTAAIVPQKQGEPAMRVQLSGDHPGRVMFRNFERRALGGYVEFLAASQFAPFTPASKLRREAVRRADRRRAALRRAFTVGG